MESLTRNLAACIAMALLAACDANVSPQTRTVVGLANASQPRLRAGTSANLYVANNLANTVTVYAPGQNSVLRKITQGLYHPRALGFDESGYLYVVVHNNIRVYAPGKVSVLRTIHAAGYLLRFDGSADMYVASVRQVFVLNRSGRVLRIITDGVDFPTTLAIDHAGNLFVANYENNTVTVYARGKTKLLRTISQGVFDPRALAFDASSNLYVANYGTSQRNVGSVSVYAPGSSGVLRTISQGVDYPGSLAFDSSNNLYVGNAAAVTVYGPGGEAPSRVISAGVTGAIGLAFDASENLFVANQGNNTITEYAPGSDELTLTISEGIKLPISFGFGP